MAPASSSTSSSTWSYYVNEFEYVSGETFMSQPSAIVAALIFYVLVITVLPHRYGVLSRKDTDPKKIETAETQRSFYKPFYLAHNLFLSIGSAFMCAGMISSYAQEFSEQASFAGFMDQMICDGERQLFHKLQFWLWLFLVSKVYEFLDTIFLCLTMRRVIPLHYIHHILTLLIAWIGVEVKFTVMGIACVMNTFIHVIMYAYYAYKLVHPEFDPWWKESFTKFQMRQFMVNIVGLAAWTFMVSVQGRQCTGEMWVIYMVLFTMVVFLAMFAAFAKKAYAGNKNKARKE